MSDPPGNIETEEEPSFDFLSPLGGKRYVEKARASTGVNKKLLGCMIVQLLVTILEDRFRCRPFTAFLNWSNRLPLVNIIVA